MNEIWEFLFCPVHGVLRPSNWPVLAPAATGILLTLRSVLIGLGRDGQKG